jgi:hypothetical protein
VTSSRKLQGSAGSQKSPKITETPKAPHNIAKKINYKAGIYLLLIV